MDVTTEEAIERWGDAVLCLALSRMGNRADAEDVFQTVFLRFHQAPSRFEGEEHAKAWLLRVTLNCCNDLHRSPWKKRRVAFDEQLAEQLPAVPAAAGVLSGEGVVVRAIGFLDASGAGGIGGAGDVGSEGGMHARLALAVERLPVKQRTAVHLFYGEGYSTDEIAHITGERPSTVRSHLHRARKALKISLGAQS